MQGEEKPELPAEHPGKVTIERAFDQVGHVRNPEDAMDRPAQPHRELGPPFRFQRRRSQHLLQETDGLGVVAQLRGLARGAFGGLHPLVDAIGAPQVVGDLAERDRPQRPQRGRRGGVQLLSA